MVDLEGATDVTRTYTSGRRGESIQVRLNNQGNTSSYDDGELTLDFETPDEVEVHDVTSASQTSDGVWELLTEMDADSTLGLHFSVRRDGDREELLTQTVTVIVRHDGSELDRLDFTVYG